ncbi:sugar kinase [Hydrogenoanaerobacterium sp.]|uniref:sugar kinase n=1 Tax=Hydrogenoanaerobacterium sp. TaxID=2953763 RepID=UPI00289AAC6A|nr:sugar kinase [Hydrogenoanaerobacterium sp.]
MSKGVMLVGEPMGLFIAQSEGALEQVTGYSLAVAGAEFNVAVGLARLEHGVTYLTKLGNDPFGKLIVSVLGQNKIGSEFVRYSNERSTGFMLKSMVSEGDPEIFYFRKNSAASTLSKEDVDAVDFSNYSFLHLTGILPALTPSTREATFYLVEKARENGLSVSFDPNLRPQLWESKEKMVEVINKLAAKADIVFPGEAEGEILCGSRDPEAISDFYLRLGAKAVVTKVGSKGAFVATAAERIMVPGFKVEKVIDTVGAGDGFAAGTISALMEGKKLKDAVLRGNAVGAIQVMSRGDNDGLPGREALAKFMGLQTL